MENRFTKNLKKTPNENIKARIQLNFFYHLEFVSKLYGTLYGRCRAKWAPKKTNPKKYLYFDKTALYCVQKILIPMFSLQTGDRFSLTDTKDNELRLE